MVYSLAWSPSGRLLAAGLGDGNIPIFSIENRSLVQTGYLPDGHDSSVASVLFPEFGKTNERLVVSGGSDGAILCWDIGPNVMEVSTMEDPKGLFTETFLGGSPSSDDPMAVDDISRKTEELSFGKPKILFGIPHEKKMNWMTTSDQCIFVADTSADITAYQLPLR
jgi:WD40 repeat protein